MKSTAECVIYMEKHVIVTKMFTNGLNLDLPQRALFEKFMEWKHTDSLVMKRFQTQRSVKKVRLTVLWDVKEPITIDFFE